jgi:hypothetical protein
LLLVSLSIWTPFMSLFTGALEAEYAESLFGHHPFARRGEAISPRSFGGHTFNQQLVAVFFFSGVHLTGERAIFALGFRLQAVLPRSS